MLKQGAHLITRRNRFLAMCAWCGNVPDSNERMKMFYCLRYFAAGDVTPRTQQKKGKKKVTSTV